MKKIEMIFYKTTPSETNTGLKFVLWAVDGPAGIAHDWGFCEWKGTEWDEIQVPEGYTASVVRWANTVEPDLLLNESKIISLGS